MSEYNYGVRGRTAATAATADNGIAALWNPHATKRLTVYEIGLMAASAPASGASVYLRRTSARGTAGSTVTPGIQNGYQRDIAPVSGVLLDLAAYSVQPTFETGGLKGWVLMAVAAATILYPISKGIVVPPGTGLALVTAAAIIIPISEVWAVWAE